MLQSYMHELDMTEQLNNNILTNTFNDLFFFYSDCPNSNKVISHCGFDLHFLMISDVEHMTIGHLYIFFEQMSIQASVHF